MIMLKQQTKDKIVDMLVNNVPTKTIKKQLKVGMPSIHRVAHENSIFEIDLPDASDRLEDRVCELFKQGKTISEISRSTGKRVLLIKQILILNKFADFEGVVVPAKYSYLDLTKIG